MGLLVGLRVSFLTLVDGFCGGFLIGILVGYDICLFVSTHFFPIDYGFTDVLRAAVLVDGFPYAPHAVLIEL